MSDDVREPARMSAEAFSEALPQLPSQRMETGTAILLVDDHPENLVALGAVLEPLGERLIAVESGDQALRTLLREEVAVILLDVRMGGLDGLQTARIVRARARTRHIPIIFLTAQTSEVQEIALAYATGAVDYVVKPFEPQILRAKVAAFVELSRERRERLRQSRARADAEAVARTVRTLQVLSDAALSHLEMDGLTGELVERAATLFRADAACLLLREDTRPALRLYAAHGSGLPSGVEDRVILGEGTLGTLAVQRRAALLRGGELLAGATGEAGDEESAATGSLLAVPLVSSDQLMGLLLLSSGSERSFDSGDLEVLTLAADRMATAIDHIQQFAQGRQLVETLQRSLLPDRLPHHPRLQIAARYLPSGLAPQIGGDWYDALVLDSDRTAVMIGDVVGHGIKSATTMSELRNALRAFMVEGHGPGAALHHLDRVVYATFGSGMIATVLVVIVDAHAQSVTVARAGHPPPALRSADGEVRILEAKSTLPLGVDEHVQFDEAVYPFGVGDTLLLYTDGLVERRRESINVGLDRLCEALSGASADVEDLCERALELTVGEQASHDDVALLAVQLLEPPGGRLELVLPASKNSIPVARHRLRGWLRAGLPDLDPAVAGDLELVWSEACTNVVRHAYGPGDATFEATAALQAGTITLEVRDSGGWRPPRGDHGGRGIMLMRALTDDVTIDRRDDGTTVRIRQAIRPVMLDAQTDAA
jgi:serine phosphatase RsbU (regulator of sigma subunit)/CheY-like chemotaxis protein/anti-sigma regulatory factor (Ser/Thr protein kinase)